MAPVHPDDDAVPGPSRARGPRRGLPEDVRRGRPAAVVTAPTPLTSGIPATTASGTPRSPGPARPSRPRAVAAAVAARPWLLVLLVWVASRLVTTAVVAVVELSTRGWPARDMDGGEGVMGLLSSWDGVWFRQIATEGYPTDLPVDDDGQVQKSAWAFLALYPAVVRLAMTLTGLPFEVAGVAVSVVAGGAAALVLHRLLAERVGPRAALWGTVFFCANPLSVVLQATYAESLSLLATFAALLFVQRRRWLPFALVTVLAAATRPGAIALTAVVVVATVLRLVRRERVTLREHVAIWSAVLVTGAAGLAWPVVADLVTGTRDAYLLTETAWWQSYVDHPGHFVPFTPWFSMATEWLGPVGPVVVVLAVAAMAWAVLFRTSRTGETIKLWAGGYVGYLVAVFLPQHSTFRMLLPLSPLFGQPWLSATRRRALVTLSTCLALQPVAVLLLWVVWPP